MSCELDQENLSLPWKQQQQPSSDFDLTPTRSDRILRRLAFILLVNLISVRLIALLPVLWWPLASIIPVSATFVTFLFVLNDVIRLYDRYVVDDDFLRLESGLYSRETRPIHFSAFTEVTVVRSVFQRIFLGTGDIVLRTAEEVGNDQIGLSPLASLAGIAISRSNKRLEKIVLRDVPDPLTHAQIIQLNILKAREKSLPR